MLQSLSRDASAGPALPEHAGSVYFLAQGIGLHFSPAVPHGSEALALRSLEQRTEAAILCCRRASLLLLCCLQPSVPSAGTLRPTSCRSRSALLMSPCRPSTNVPTESATTAGAKADGIPSHEMSHIGRGSRATSITGFSHSDASRFTLS